MIDFELWREKSDNHCITVEYKLIVDKFVQ